MNTKSEICNFQTIFQASQLFPGLVCAFFSDAIFYADVTAGLCPQEEEESLPTSAAGGTEGQEAPPRPQPYPPASAHPPLSSQKPQTPKRLICAEFRNRCWAVLAATRSTPRFLRNRDPAMARGRTKGPPHPPNTKSIPCRTPMHFTSALKGRCGCISSYFSAMPRSAIF